MSSDTAVGGFMLLTSVIVLVPVLLQLRDGRFRFREVWGLFVLVAGFATVGFGYAFYDGDVRQRIALTGLAAVILGLLAQHNRRDVAPRDGEEPGP
jgi:uncharacterized membrane protein YfcA